MKVGSGGALTITSADLSAATAAVARMSIAERAGSVLMPATSQVRNPATVRSLHLGGVILMGAKGIPDGTTTGTPDEVAAVTAGIQRARSAGAPPLLVGTDQEYGDVVRLVNGFTDFPGANRLAAIADTAAAVDITRRIASAAAQEMLAVGVTVDFAPDADVLPDDGSESAIGNRSYGADPNRTGRLVAAAVTGYQQAGVAATLKHFPGIGRISTDTHVALPTFDGDCNLWNSLDSVPMAAGIQAGTALVMTGHVLLPAVGANSRPASLAPEVVTSLLRGRGVDGCRGMGFTGITVTDSMQMAPVVDAFSPQAAAAQGFRAGQDLLLLPSDPAQAVTGIVAAVADGSLPEARLTDAAVRVYALRLALARVKRPSMDVVDSAEHRALADEAAQLASG